MKHIFSRTALAVLSAGLLQLLPMGQRGSQAQEISRSSAQSQTFAPIELRGYGKISGVSRQEKSGSVLEITCEDADKAKLTQAKYLSDLGLIPGVKEIKDSDYTRYDIESQGSVAAFCDANKVAILSSPSADDLASLVKQFKPAGVSTAQMQVPMYLDRWDKFGFRSYYVEWQLPSGANAETYDYTADFDYAKAQDTTGIVYWSWPQNSDTADGMMNYGHWNWIPRETAKRNLPTAVYLGGRAGFEPTWLLNRYREQTQLKEPGFTGNFHSLMSPYLGGTGAISWHSTTGQDAMLSLLQETVRRCAADPTFTSLRESHQETRHGDQDIFLEHGPVIDADYRIYLRETYGTPDKVAARWGMPIKSWEDVHSPEIRSFAGWNADAVDVGGTWKVAFEELAQAESSEYNWYNQRIAPKTKPAPEEWFNSDFDDSAWAENPGAGHDRQMFMPKRPAIFRRTFDLPSDWKTKNPRAWLQVWDLNLATGEEVRVVLNGKELGRSKIGSAIHRAAFEATEALKPGKNSLAIRLPQGYIAYSTYLTSVEPRQYPHLGESLNAQWTDFTDFTRWSRIRAIRRGMEMIRQVVPNHPIALASPTANVDGLKMLAEKYGGGFHDTGYMGAVWYDALPSLMRGAGLPFSLESGESATDLNDFKKQIGLWQTEGVQGVDYYRHLGTLMWNPDIKAEFESQRKQLALMGRMHYPKAEVATLRSDRVGALTQFPWSAQYSFIRATSWNSTADLRQRFPYDMLSDSSFSAGDADAYRLIIDADTSIMDESLIDEIEKWVRAGGVFVAIPSTGRHTSIKPDAWSIARLTGYKVSDTAAKGGVKPAAGQAIFNNDINGAQGAGLRLEKTSPEAQDLLLWDDGTIAAGMRPLGKGFVVQLGAMPANNSPKRFRDLLDPILKWQNIKPEPARLGPAGSSVILRCAVSNNGLYDIWTVWNQSPKNAQTVSIEFLDGQTPAFCLDMRSGQRLTPGGPKLEAIALEPLETRVYLTPRRRITQASSAWFNLQRNWWRGATTPEPRQLPAYAQRWARDLSEEWKVMFLDKSQDAAPMLAADFDDSAWATRRIGIWNVKDEGQGKGHAVFRKTFTVPEDWTNGPVSIWLTSWANQSFTGNGRVWLDGREVKPLNTDGYIANPLASLTPGSKHTVALEVQSDGALAGLKGQCWISFEPPPLAKLELSGQWASSADGLKFDATVSLPGAFTTQFMKRKITIPSEHRGKDVVLTVDGDRRLICAIINGRLIRRHHHTLAERGSLNLTPFIRFGEENEIELVRWDMSGGTVQWAAPGNDIVRDVFLGIYDPGFYP